LGWMVQKFAVKRLQELKLDARHRCSGIYHHRTSASVGGEFRWGQLVSPVNTIALQLIPHLAHDCKTVAPPVACYPNYSCYRKVKCFIDTNVTGKCQ